MRNGATMPQEATSTMDSRSAKPWFFDTWSRFYDEAVIQNLVYRPVHDAVVETLAPRRPTNALDLGCGTGQLTVRLKRDLGIEKVTGADFSAGMLAQAAERRRDIHWVRASASALPFADETFDAVTSTEAFHWFPDQPLALRECRRVLKPGGTLAVALVNPRAEWLGEAAHALSTLIGQPFYWPTRERMRAMLEDAGFRVDRQRRILRLAGLVLFPGVLSVAVRD